MRTDFEARIVGKCSGLNILTAHSASSEGFGCTSIAQLIGGRIRFTTYEYDALYAALQQVFSNQSRTGLIIDAHRRNEPRCGWLIKHNNRGVGLTQLKNLLEIDG